MKFHSNKTNMLGYRLRIPTSLLSVPLNTCTHVRISWKRLCSHNSVRNHGSNITMVCSMLV